MFKVIEEVTPLSDTRIHLRFSDGTAGEVDLADTLQRGGVFSALAERPVFEGVAIGEGGRYIVFPNGVDFCADALCEKLFAIEDASHGTQRAVSGAT